MFTQKWRDEELWQSALTLTKLQYYNDALQVIKSIAVMAVSFWGGRLSFPSLPTPARKMISVEEIEYMRALSKEIARLLEEKQEIEHALEKATEYVDRFAYLLADTDTEAELVHKTLVKSWIRAHMESTHDLTVPFAKENTPVYTSSEAAEIAGVSDQTIRRWCEKGKFPEAFQTDGGHWRIPQKYFKVTWEEARKAEDFMEKVDEETKRQLGEDVNEFDLDIDYS